MAETNVDPALAADMRLLMGQLRGAAVPLTPDAASAAAAAAAAANAAGGAATLQLDAADFELAEVVATDAVGADAASTSAGTSPLEQLQQQANLKLFTPSGDAGPATGCVLAAYHHSRVDRGVFRLWPWVGPRWERGAAVRVLSLRRCLLACAVGRQRRYRWRGSPWSR
jgi:hypothetical protein